MSRRIAQMPRQYKVWIVQYRDEDGRWFPMEMTYYWRRKEAADRCTFIRKLPGYNGRKVRATAYAPIAEERQR